jgi:hypothetical protein
MAQTRWVKILSFNGCYHSVGLGSYLRLVKGCFWVGFGFLKVRFEVYLVSCCLGSI